MRRWERWMFNALSAVVAASGFAYLWMKYALQSDDPFAIVNHPWQPTMLHAHVLASPPLVLAFGIVLNSHIMKKLRAAPADRHRVSGFVSLGAFATMIASGYLLQVVTAEAWLSGLVVAHVASGGVFTAAYLTHVVATMRRTARRLRPARMREVA